MRFVLIDRIDRLEPGRLAEGHKCVAADEEYFRDHFPGYPLVPGVLVLESLAQLGGRLIEASVREATGRRVLPVLAKVDRARFSRPVRPADRLDLVARLVGMTAGAARVAGVARVGGRQAAAADIMYAIVDLAGGLLDDKQLAALVDWSDGVWRELTGVGSEPDDDETV